MWTQNYYPVAGNLWLSALVAALPVVGLLYLLGVRRSPSWQAGLAGLTIAIGVALGAYRMPIGPLVSSIGYGIAFGLLPIGWIVYWAIVLYRVTVETGQFEIIKQSVGSLTQDRRLQALLIAFAFGAFLEGASGFGTPVAVAAAMLTGLGFQPFYAAGICLLANTAPVAFGAIGTPLVTLAGITGLPLLALSGSVGRLCAPLSLIVPSYLLVVMTGWRGLMGVWPAALACGVAFAATQFVVSNFIGPYLTDILSSLAAILTLVVLLKVWRPTDVPEPAAQTHTPSARAILRAWSPYGFLVLFVLLWSWPAFKIWLDVVTRVIPWPALHNQVIRVTPVAAKPSPYAAVYTLNLLSASGTACLFASALASLFLGLSPARFLSLLGSTLRQLALPLVTITSVLGLAFLMNYSGATATMGLAFAATGAAFPFFSALLGWLGVFLTGSDTSANALFGNLQVVTAGRLGLDPVLMAAANSSGGVMGKMISLQSVAVAAAATGMPAHEEAQLFRFTVRHSVVLASAIGVLAMLYVYVPGWLK